MSFLGYKTDNNKQFKLIQYEFYKLILTITNYSYPKTTTAT